MNSSRLLTLSVASALLFAACSSDGESTDSVAPATAAPDETSEPAADSSFDVVAGEAFPAARCEANEATGTITFLTGFDFAAAASIVDVITADAAGYYDDLCLDVEIRPSFSSANYPLVAAGSAQFASGGSFAEVVNFANGNEAELVAVAVAGRAAIDTLMVPGGTVGELSELEGTTIGVKGKLPASIDAMLRTADLIEGENFETVLVDGFDPIAHLELPIDALPGWKSNEVGALARADVEVDLFDPIDFGVPGSFGVTFSSAEFVAANPLAAEDFVRATMRGLADAIADPESAANTAVESITAGGNPNFLSPEGEVFRWVTEAELISGATPADTGFATPDAALLQAEIEAYAEVGLFGDASTPDAASFTDSRLIDSVYDSAGAVIWPS